MRATSPQRLSLSAKHPQVLTATWAGMTDAITTADWRASRDLLRPGPAQPRLPASIPFISRCTTHSLRSSTGRECRFRASERAAETPTDGIYKRPCSTRRTDGRRPLRSGSDSILLSRTLVNVINRVQQAPYAAITCYVPFNESLLISFYKFNSNVDSGAIDEHYASHGGVR